MDTPSALVELLREYGVASAKFSLLHVQVIHGIQRLIEAIQRSNDIKKTLTAFRMCIYLGRT
jgi:hypothetical protein